MLQKLGTKTLIHHAWDLASEWFDPDCVLVSIPETDGDSALAAELDRINATYFAEPDIPEQDVLARITATAHRYRWHPDSTIVRWTPDDPFKTWDLVDCAVNGWRPAVESGAEAFTLAMLDYANETSHEREHITLALFPNAAPAPEAAPHPWTIDTPEDLAAANAWLAQGGRL